MNKNVPKKFIEIGKNKLHLMLLQLKIGCANSVGEHLQPIMSKECAWETTKEMNYFIHLLLGLRYCACHAMDEAVNGWLATVKLAFSPMRFSVQFVVAE
jgi:hypothetical protein